MTQQDTGFYARTPRIVRTEYKNLTITEKWFYTCLKDLCGDKGTCFRTLRTLAQETDISISTLSHAIHHLHEVGLIHAEKKLRGLGGKEVWHITIVDIWQANAEYCFSSEQHAHTVPVKNNVVFSANNDAKSCFSSERSCLDFTHRRRNNEEDTIEERKGEEDHEEPTPFSCSREIRGIKVSLEEEQEEQEEQQQTPSWYKTDRKAVSKKPAATYTKVLVPPPSPPTPVPSTASTPLIQGEPRPLTKNEQKYLNEQERNNIWKAIEEVFQTSFPYGVRTQGYNTRGMDALLADHYSSDDVKKALTGMEPFHRNNLKASFSLEKLHPRMPGLLAAREEPPKPAAHSSRPLDITPPIGGRRLDSGPGMMPGLKGVRHA